MIAGALSVALLLALAGDPPEPPEAAAPAPDTAALAPAAGLGAGQFVAVVRPVTQDQLLQEASSRIRSELAASGLESRIVDCAEPTEAPCPGPDAAAAIELGRKDGVVEIDVRAFLPDGFELSRHVRVLDRDGGQDPSVLGVRAVELLRDLRLNAQRRAPAGPLGPARDPEDPKPPTPPPPEDLEGSRLHKSPAPLGWRLSTGVAVLASPGGAQPGVGPAFGAALGASAVLNQHLSTALTVSGPFNATFLEVAGHQATLVQALATLELRFRISRGRFQPFASVLSGVNYLRANFRSASPSVALASSTDTAWVPLFGAGGGVSFDFWQRFTAGAGFEVFATAPPMLVQIEDDSQVVHVVGRTGAPSILVTADLGLTLP